MKSQNPRIEEAFENVPREHFMPASEKSLALLDQAIPIGFGQTTSQPTTVRMMLEWLNPQPGDKVLDIGSGSGWTTALLAYLVGPTGRVDAVELIPELVAFGSGNCASLHVTNAFFHLAGSFLGWPEGAPYDRILVSAAAEKLPVELLQQLKPGGKLVIPVQNDILEITKEEDDKIFETVAHSGFAFVPLIAQ